MMVIMANNNKETNSNTMDIEMEVEEQQQQQPPPSENSVPSLLSMARQHIHQGNPSLALQAVMMAMGLVGGENAINWTLQRARELYRHRMQENVAADQLAALFAECAIAEASPGPPVEAPICNDVNLIGPSAVAEANESSILAESGRMQVVMDAAADGSSFICLKCGGLVSNSRRDEHLAYWCG